MLTSLRGTYWLNHRHGFEGSVKTKVTDYSELASQVEPLQLEARYHMRFQVPFFWKWLMPQFQFSFFTGFEHYTNSSANNTFFTTGYQLYKLGGAVKFPIFDNWDTGGEILYGLGSGGNAKIEMQGYLNYYLTQRWSLGLGYRVHLLRVEDESILPEGSTLPLREVYGEAFGNLRFSF